MADRALEHVEMPVAVDVRDRHQGAEPCVTARGCAASASGRARTAGTSEQQLDRPGSAVLHRERIALRGADDEVGVAVAVEVARRDGGAEGALPPGM